MQDNVLDIRNTTVPIFLSLYDAVIMIDYNEAVPRTTVSYNCVKRSQVCNVTKIEINLMDEMMWSRKSGKAFPSLKMETLNRASKDEKRKTCLAKIRACKSVLWWEVAWYVGRTERRPVSLQRSEPRGAMT